MNVSANVHCVHAGLLSLNSDKYTLRKEKKDRRYCIGIKNVWIRCTSLKKGLLKIIKLMLILSQVRLSKS